MFESHEQALEYGIAYVDYHNAWGNTAAGSAQAARALLSLSKTLASISVRDSRAMITLAGDPWYKIAWNAYWGKWADVLRINEVKMPGIIIIGKGGEEFGLKDVGDGKIGVLDMSDPNNIIAVLDFTTADQVWDTGHGAVGLYYDNPLNDWYGHFFDRVPVWMESTKYPGMYWNTTGDLNFKGQLYVPKETDNGSHIMYPTGIPFPEQ